jgi:hypothetical protein
MSRYYVNYPQYLGSRKCCDLRTPGPVGSAGPTGPAGIGERGWTGPSIVPIISPTGASYPGMTYDTSNNQIYYDVAKSFIINHPVKQDKYLVHACLEGPEAGVYYRGVGEISNNNSTIIKLPYYVDKFSTDFTIQITPIYNGRINILNAGEVSNNLFTVYGENCKFYWHVYGKRMNIEVEPLKTDVNVKGNGPYLYI